MERLKLQTEFSDDLSGAWVGRGEAVDRKLSWKSLRSEVTGMEKEGAH